MTRPTWSAKGQLISRNPYKGPSLQCEFDEPGNYTVQFWVGNQSAVPPAAPTTKGTITPTGEVTWSIGGNQLRRLISIYDGVSISGVAEHVIVRAYDETDVADITPQQQYNVGISVAKGIRPASANPPTYSQGIAGNVLVGVAVVPPSGNVSVPVPLDAGVVSVDISAGPTTPAVLSEADLQVVQVTAGGNAVKRYDPRLKGFVPVSSQCSSIDLFNNTSGPGVTILFNVTFGIDG